MTPARLAKIPGAAAPRPADLLDRMTRLWR